MFVSLLRIKYHTVSLTRDYKALLGFYTLFGMQVRCLEMSKVYAFNLSKDTNFYFTIGTIIFIWYVQKCNLEITNICKITQNLIKNRR